MLLGSMAARLSSSVAPQQPSSVAACFLASLFIQWFGAFQLDNEASLSLAMWLLLTCLGVNLSLLSGFILAAPIAMAPIPAYPLDWCFPLAWWLHQIGSLGSSMDLPPLALAQMNTFLSTQQSNRNKSASLAPFGLG